MWRTGICVQCSYCETFLESQLPYSFSPQCGLELLATDIVGYDASQNIVTVSDAYGLYTADLSYQTPYDTQVQDFTCTNYRSISVRLIGKLTSDCILTTLSDLLLQFQARTQAELDALNQANIRNATIVEIELRTNFTAATMQTMTDRDILDIFCNGLGLPCSSHDACTGFCVADEYDQSLTGTCQPVCTDCSENGQLSPFDGTCPTCELFVNSNPLSWASAESHCNAIGGNLMSIHSEQENIRAKELHAVIGDFWIGASDLSQEGNWSWSDGTAFDFEAWGRGSRELFEEPNGNIEENCVAMCFNWYIEAPAWNDYNCSDGRSSVCYVPHLIPQPTYPPVPRPTQYPVPIPTGFPVPLPTSAPIPNPSHIPTTLPTADPTKIPSDVPTEVPSEHPTEAPSEQPTETPSEIPTGSPSKIPTSYPTEHPSESPTEVPTETPTDEVEVEELGEGDPEEGETESDESDEYESEEDLDMNIVIQGDLINSCELDGSVLSLEFFEGQATEGDIESCEISGHFGDTQEPEDGDQTEGDDESEVAADDGGVSGHVSGAASCAFGVANGPVGSITVTRYVGDIGGCFLLANKQPEIDVVSQVVHIEIAEDADLTYEFILRTFPEEIECSEDFDSSSSFSCEWYNEAARVWTDSGCIVLDTGIKLDSGGVGTRCSCSHLTAFAILQDTGKLKDQCSLSTVLGNPLWLVFMILYSILLLATLIEFVRFVSRARNNKTKPRLRFIIYSILAMVCVLNMTIAGVLYTSTDSVPAVVLRLLAVIWSMMYILSYAVFSLVVYTWASLVSPKSTTKVRKVFLISGTIASLLVLSMFVATAVSSSDAQAVHALVGSTIVGIICVLMAICVLVYGLMFILKLYQAGEMLDDPTDQTNFVEMAKRVTAVVSVTSVAFVVQSIILILSASDRQLFFDNFTLLQSVYLAFDLLLLFAMLVLFFINPAMSSNRVTTHKVAYNVSESNSGVEMQPVQHHT